MNGHRSTMLFKGDSALIRLPHGTEVKEVMHLDALRYAAEMVELSYTRLCSALSGIAEEGDEDRHRLLSLQVLHDAWAVIDSADRLTSLVRTAKFCFSEEDRRSFSEGMADVRKLRNTVQHLDGKIATLAAKGWPVWGTVGWFEWTAPPHVGRFGFLAAGNRVTLREEVVQSPKDGDVSLGISQVVLASEGVEVSLRTVRENVVQVAQALEQGVNDEYAQDSRKRLTSDVFVSGNVDFRRKQLD